MTHFDPLITSLVAIILAVFCLSLVLKIFKQPYIIGYIIAGFILGPHVFGLVQQPEILVRMGNLGVILLLFFVGLELSPKGLKDNWIVSFSGTILQILVTILIMFFLSFLFHWTWQQILLLSFIVSLSSTSVVFKLLQDWREVNTRTGQNVIGILLVQDIFVFPMIIIMGLLADQRVNFNSIVLQIMGGIILISLTIWITVNEKINLPLLNKLSNDTETQLFLSLILCFGMATVAGLFKLNAALGAFVGGMLVSSIKETTWVYNHLLPLRTIFIAFFFISIGMLIQPQVIQQYFDEIILLTLTILIVNTLINASILKALGESWRASLYGGSLLSQIGEFSFLLSILGYQKKIISNEFYQIINSTIALSLLISPLWIMFIKKMISKAELKLKKSRVS